MLTAADVEKKTFSTALRGYDLDEVDDFLDEVVSTIRRLTEELEAARAGVVVAEPAAVPAPVEPAPPPAEIDETSVGRALVAAQRAADELLAEAQQEAARLIAEAQEEADTWIAEREAKRVEAEEEMASLSSRIAAVRAQLAVLAGEVADRLDQMDAVIAGETVEVERDVMEDERDAMEDEPEATMIAATLDYGDSPDSSPMEGEDMEGAGDDRGGGGSDHLDEILTGVVTDLRLGVGQEDEGEEEDEDE